MTMQQATSRRGITHLVELSRQTTGPQADSTYKALCGAEVGRGHLLPPIWPPAGRSCARCARHITRLKKWTDHVEATFTFGVEAGA